MAERFGFRLLGTCDRTSARRGRLVTLHGEVETPVFMPVGTLGTVKSLDPRDLDALGARMVLANAYHLMLRPGLDIVRRFGGLHRFAGLDCAILTDSGGYQIYSLSGLRTITDEGATFRSHIDGTLWELSPEKLVEVQEGLGPDVAMVLDECPAAQADRDTTARAVQRSTVWARRCLDARTRDEVAWFGINQGGLHDDLRREHAEALAELPCDGYAIGGVSVGESTDQIRRVVANTTPYLPEAKARYLMGVGTPSDLVWGVAAGIDMFDCVLPTRNARNGQLFTSRGTLTIKNARHRSSQDPIDSTCGCYTCLRFSRAYLRHLYENHEISYCRLATLHNLSFYLGLMTEVRAAIAEQRFVPEQMVAAWETPAV